MSGPYVSAGSRTGEVLLRGLADSDGRAVAYVLTFAEARDLGRQLFERAGTPDREPAPEDLVRRLRRLEDLILRADVSPEALEDVEAEAALIRSEREAADVL